MSGYLSPDDAKDLVAQALERIRDVRGDVRSMNNDVGPQVEKLAALERKLSNFQARRGPPPFKGIPASEVTVYRKIFQALAGMSRSPRMAREAMETIVAQTC